MYDSVKNVGTDPNVTVSVDETPLEIQHGSPDCVTATLGQTSFVAFVAFVFLEFGCA